VATGIGGNGVPCTETFTIGVLPFGETRSCEYVATRWLSTSPWKAHGRVELDSFAQNGPRY
jgi:hypothetical protein